MDEAKLSNTAEALVELLTKAVGDLTAALIMAGKQDKIKAWTAPYIEAINQFDDGLPVASGGPEE